MLWVLWVEFVWGWPRLPPLFVATRRDRSWTTGPATAVEEGLRAGRYAPAIDFARYRVGRVLRARFEVDARGNPLLERPAGELPPEVQELVRIRRTLDRAFQLATEAEAPAEDLWTRRAQPRRHAEALAAFTSVLPEMETILPPLEVGL